MDRYLCEPCGYVYDPDVGDPDHDIPAGTAFEDLPDTFSSQNQSLMFGMKQPAD